MRSDIAGLYPEVPADATGWANRMTADIPTIETARLILPPLALADTDAVQETFPQWDIVRFLAGPIAWPYPADGALTFIRDRALPAMREGREWHWSIRPKAMPERLIGIIGLTGKPDDNRGFWLDPAWQRQGLMTEAVIAVTDFWFETLGQPVLRVVKAVQNIASRRISERSGMRVIKVEERDYTAGRMPVEIWEITRDEWRNRPR
jgi:ribosomal-protein-alanine N-acetyltransferase